MEKHSFDIRYLFPNFFTALSAFLGVISIIASIHNEYEKAAWLIFISLILDGIDGRVARMTNATSKFGVEFDSLADLVAFGVAPAILLYQAIGSHFGKFGSLVAALFVVFGAIRLARFNVMAPSSEPSVFIGVPIPTAAVFVAGWVMLYQKYGLAHFSFAILVGALCVALLMVSNIRYPSFKKIDFKKHQVVKILVIMVIVLAVLYLYPAEFVTIMITLFICAGVVRTVYFLFKRKIRYNNGKILSKEKDE
ncbi:CDP-diacylglycerol--serine O-phosphatidyltransferase [Nitratiruptor tergarcus]|uniref:CDP-diacylglycerol--serine O-phosphatidyltransferase n=1 Tax=Nitratiruptor tergarcus DSM 16512 TaxID=1069081 RepID=A0A1W1WV20_9BACT|nr:CDP-diacylglycerol--serine O-phosphatidyltransferase [Nitratiruptor tergarcus]SMC10127.1 CDP-diacylglycerol---serine O-phosphatidyltransferase [Nitratiruptor tergarcus DSM 16512]